MARAKPIMKRTPARRAGAGAGGPKKVTKRAPKPKKLKPRVKRLLEAREAKIVENPKVLLAMHGTKTSAEIKQLLSDLVALRRPHAQRLSKSNTARPFEDTTSVEFLGQKRDASLFAFGSHTKKRPHCLVLGRLFDYHVLDMAEFLVSGIKPLRAFAAGFHPGSPVALVFDGSDFEHKPELGVVRNLLHDIFGERELEQVPAKLPAERVLVFTAHGDGMIAMRHYATSVGGGAKGGARRVELTEIGPRCDLKLMRTRFADDEHRKAALKQPKATAAKPTKQKNVEHTALLGKRGKLRVERQDLQQAAIKKMKALRAAKKTGSGSAGASKAASVKPKAGRGE